MRKEQTVFHRCQDFVRSSERLMQPFERLIVGAFLVSLLLVALLPLFACGLVDCSSDDDGYKTVSRLIHEGALASTFSYFGALFLFTHFALQMHGEHKKILIAFVAALALSVPLVLPLGSIYSDYYHSAFAVSGAFLEMIVTVLLLWKRIRYVQCGGFLLQFSAFVIGCTGLWTPESSFQSVSLLVAEYVFGTGTVCVTLSAYMQLHD